MQYDIVSNRVANNGVTGNLDSRVRIDINRSVNQVGITTFHIRNEHDRICVGRRIAIHSDRGIPVSVSVGATDLLTILIPYIVTAGHFCHLEDNFTAEADGRVTHMSEHKRGRRDDLHRVITFCHTTGVGLTNLHLIDVLVLRIGGRMQSDCTAGRTKDRLELTRSGVVFRPSVGQHIIIIVNEVSRESDFTTVADGISRSGDFNLHRVINIDIVRFAGNDTTSLISDGDREDVRLVARSSFVLQGVVCLCTRTDRLVEESPFITVSQASNSVIQISLEHNHAILTDNLVARNLDCRRREYKERICLHFRDTTAVLLRNHHTIDIDCSVIVRGNGKFAEDRIIGTNDFHTILVPSVGVSNAGNTKRIVRHSRNLDLITFANRIFVHDNSVNGRNAIHLDVSNIVGLTT